MDRLLILICDRAVRRTSLFLVLLGAEVGAHTYNFEAVYTGDVASNLSGGLETGSRYLDNLDVMLEIDLASAWDGGAGRLFLYGLYNNGTTLTDDLIGDLQVTNNIEAPEAWRLYEAWYEYGGEDWSLRTGLYDLNTEFDASETAGLFLNSSHGIGAALAQTGENGPGIFPVAALALRGAWSRGDLTTRVAVLDGVPGDPDDPASSAIRLSSDEGLLLIGEIDQALGGGGRFWASYWRYTAQFARPFSSGESNDNSGWYVGIETPLQFAGQKAEVFLRYGRANEDLNVFEDFLGAGIVFSGMGQMKSDDRFGIALASAGVGGPYRRFLEQTGARSTARETIWELSYRMVVNEHLAIQPDLQFVQNPAADRSTPNALVAFLRFELSY